MSIVSVHELAGRQSSLNWKYQRSYSRKFQVVSNTPFEDPINVETATGIPLVLASYPTDVNARVQSKKATQQDDQHKWIVDVEYSSVFDMDPANSNENPLLRPPIFKFTYEKATKAVRYDLSDEAIENSAGVPFDPPLEIETSIPIISISVNKATFNYPLISQVQDCVNQSTWNGFGPGTVKVRGIEVSEVWENNQLYFAYNWTLAVKYDQWRPHKVVDMGWHEYNGGDPLLIRDKFGAPLPSPSLLDGNGERLPAGDDPVLLEFDLNRAINFAAIPIP